MLELRQALEDISAIRTQVARETQFRGYGPLSVAASGLLALAVAAAHRIVGMTYSAPVRMPAGQRAVTVFSRV